MEIKEIILFAAEIAARWSWSAKVGQCVVEKNPATGQTEIFQRKPICHKVDGERIILWKEGKEERKFQIIIPETIEMETMVEVVGKAAMAGARLWDDVALISSISAQPCRRDADCRDWHKNGVFFIKEYSIKTAILRISLKSWSSTGTVPTFSLFLKNEEEYWIITEEVDYFII